MQTNDAHASMIRAAADSLRGPCDEYDTKLIDHLAMALISRLTYEQVCDAHPLFYDLETCQDNDCTDNQCKKTHFDC